MDARAVVIAVLVGAGAVLMAVALRRVWTDPNDVSEVERTQHPRHFGEIEKARAIERVNRKT